MENEDNYKRTFKLYKNFDEKSEKLPLINLSSFEEHFFEGRKIFEKTSLNLHRSKMPECDTLTHFKPFDEWEIFEILEPETEGLLIIPGILKHEFRAEWFRYFRDELPKQKSELNLKANVAWDNIDKLRWITFGYHHDWNNKIYHLDQNDVRIPERIQDLSKIISVCLYPQIGFKPEAGIVNYYAQNSSLCFHTDHSELNHKAPLLSLSLGSSAIFLIGGLTKNSSTPILPILLNDSDLVIMSDKSRLALHSVPKILPKSMESSKKQQSKSSICRINVNIRQVF